MSLLPYTSPYYRGSYPYASGAFPYAYGAYPCWPYGMTAEEIKKVREAEEAAFVEAETKRKEFMEAEKAKYEEFVAAEKKKCEDYVAAQKKAVEDAIAKEKELTEKLGPYAYGPYGVGGPFGYGYGYPGAFHPGPRLGGYPYF